MRSGLTWDLSDFASYPIFTPLLLGTRFVILRGRASYSLRAVFFVETGFGLPHRPLAHLCSMSEESTVFRSFNDPRTKALP